MQANRRIDTRPEMQLRSELHRQGLRFRKDAVVKTPSIRVKVDVLFPRQRIAVFVDGCFWHACPDHMTWPKANAAWWRTKLTRNRERDQKVNADLRVAGWTVIRVWEHEKPDEAAQSICLAVRKALQENQPSVRA
jgi:DNA mismatch endonuclease, patch repair protein